MEPAADRRLPTRRRARARALAQTPDRRQPSGVHRAGPDGRLPSHALDLVAFVGIGGRWPPPSGNRRLGSRGQALVGFVGFVVAFISLAALQLRAGPVLPRHGHLRRRGLTIAGAILTARSSKRRCPSLCAARGCDAIGHLHSADSMTSGSWASGTPTSHSPSSSRSSCYLSSSRSASRSAQSVGLFLSRWSRAPRRTSIRRSRCTGRTGPCRPIR